MVGAAFVTRVELAPGYFRPYWALHSVRLRPESSMEINGKDIKQGSGGPSQTSTLLRHLHRKVVGIEGGGHRLMERSAPPVQAFELKTTIVHRQAGGTIKSNSGRNCGH